eukprot:1159300-Pelagomonas_calceolata.AAC.5
MCMVSTPLIRAQVFRLAQLIIEYLLYVQDCLQSTNGYLQQHRCGSSQMPCLTEVPVQYIHSCFLQKDFWSCSRTIVHTQISVRALPAQLSAEGGIGANTKSCTLQHSRGAGPQTAANIDGSQSCLCFDICQLQLAAGLSMPPLLSSKSQPASGQCQCLTAPYEHMSSVIRVRVCARRAHTHTHPPHNVKTDTAAHPTSKRAQQALTLCLGLSRALCCRSQQEKYISAARLRVRELEAGFKTAKRELRHARKTVKTFETMAVMGKLGGLKQQGHDVRCPAVPALTLALTSPCVVAKLMVSLKN